MQIICDGCGAKVSVPKHGFVAECKKCGTKHGLNYSTMDYAPIKPNQCTKCAQYLNFAGTPGKHIAHCCGIEYRYDTDPMQVYVTEPIAKDRNNNPCYPGGWGSKDFARRVMGQFATPPTIPAPVTSFFPPGEPSLEECADNLLKALQKQREAKLEIRTWERLLRKRREATQ